MAINFVAIDIETAAPKRDSICSISLIRVRDGIIVDTFSSLVNPHCEFCAVNTGIHGIRPEDVADAPDFAGVAPAIFDFIGGDVLVAHNMSFDGDVLAKTCERFDIPMPPLRMLCSCTYAQRVLPQLPNYRLPTCCAHYGISLEHHHDADMDAAACAELMVCLARDMQLASLDDIAHIAGTPGKKAACKPPHTLICGVEVYKFYLETLATLCENLHSRIDTASLRFQIHQNNTVSVHTSVGLFRLAYHSVKGFFVLVSDRADSLSTRFPAFRIEATTNPADLAATWARIYLPKPSDISALTDYLIGIIQNGPALQPDRSCCVDLTALRLGDCDFDDRVSSCRFGYESPDALLIDLRTVNPELAGEIDMEPMADGRTLSCKCSGGLIFYLVDGKVPFIKAAGIRNPLLVHKSASPYKTGEYKYSLNSSFRYRQFLLEMIDICRQKALSRAGDQFACCNDFIRCSDACHCLHLNNPDYRGCQYRKNLESGHIFYGENRNI